MITHSKRVYEAGSCIALNRGHAFIGPRRSSSIVTKITTSNLVSRIFATMKKRTPGFIQSHTLPIEKIQRIVTRMETKEPKL